MFEAVIPICIALAQPVCYDKLLPGYEAATLAECQALLASEPPDPQVKCQPAGPVLSVSQIAPGVFVHEGQIAEPDAVNAGDTSNLGFVIGATSVAAIDTGTARWMGEALWRAIRQKTDKPVGYVILTHTHPDHVFGASVLQEAGAQIVGHQKLERALADRGANYLESLSALIGDSFAGTELPTITTPVTDETEIDLGGRTLTLTAWQTAHTNADLTVFDQETETLFAGDLIFNQHTPALDGRLRGWQKVLDHMRQIKAKRVVPGHGQAAMLWPQAATPVTRYLGVLATDTKAAIDNGEHLGDAVKHIGQSESPHWMLFDAFNPRNATAAFTELEWE